MNPSDVCLSYLAGFATGRADDVVAWVTDDFVNEHTAALGRGCVGRTEYATRVPGFLASMPGLRYDIEEVLADDNRIAIAYVMRATVNDRDVAVRGVMRFLVRDGLVAKRVDYWDSLVFQEQAGLT